MSTSTIYSFQPHVLPTKVVQPCRQVADDETWEDLYQVITAFVRKSLSRMNTPTSWRGQEAYIAEDLVQETMLRVVRYLKRVDSGEMQMPQSLTAYAVVIAKNCLWDLFRHEHHLRLMHGDEADEKEFEQEQMPALDQAVDNIETECLLHQAAVTVARFPEKQRKAVLVDLAGSMHFGRKQTFLQKAFSSLGIHLQDYLRPHPASPAERARQSALRSLAYKRVARELSPW